MTLFIECLFHFKASFLHYTNGVYDKHEKGKKTWKFCLLEKRNYGDLCEALQTNFIQDGCFVFFNVIFYTFL